MSADEPTPKPEVRMSNAEREVIVDRLKIAQDEGRIELHEFEERVGRVYAARVASEVGDVLADLPAAQPPPPTPAAAVSYPAPGMQTIHATPVRRRRWMVAVLSGRQSRGRWSPGAPSRTVTLLGSQTLDLTQVDELDIDIRAFTMMGETKIIVPPGAHVETNGFIVMGETSNKTHDDPDVPSSPMRVRVTSYGLMGECKIRTPGTRDKLRTIIRNKVRELE